MISSSFAALGNKTSIENLCNVSFIRAKTFVNENFEGSDKFHELKSHVLVTPQSKMFDFSLNIYPEMNILNIHDLNFERVAKISILVNDYDSENSQNAMQFENLTSHVEKFDLSMRFYYELNEMNSVESGGTYSDLEPEISYQEVRSTKTVFPIEFFDSNGIFSSMLWFSWFGPEQYLMLIHMYNSLWGCYVWRLNFLINLMFLMRSGKFHRLFPWFPVSSMRDRYKVYRIIFHTMFGPQFVSDNAGDGPDSEQENTKSKTSFSDLPMFQSENYQRWQRTFIALLPKNLDLIISGEEKPCHPTYTDEYIDNIDDATEKANVKEEKLKFEKDYIKRNKLLYQAIMATIVKNGDGPNHELGLSLLDDVKNFDGLAAWNKLKQFHLDKSSQNKFSVVIEMLKLSQEKSESALDFKVRVEAAFRIIENLEVKISDLKVICFLNGLKSRYSSIVNTLSVQTNSFTLDDVLKQLKSYDTREHGNEDKAEANLSNTPKAPSTSTTDANLAKSLSDLKAMYGQLSSRIKKSAGNKRSRPEFREKRDKRNKESFSDKNANHFMTIKELNDKYGRSPAPFEKNGICNICNSTGHHARTCNKNKNKA